MYLSAVEELCLSLQRVQEQAAVASPRLVRSL